MTGVLFARAAWALGFDQDVIKSVKEDKGPLMTQVTPPLYLPTPPCTGASDDTSSLTLGMFGKGG